LSFFSLIALPKLIYDTTNYRVITVLKPCDKNIVKTLKLVDEMIDLANHGDIEREDVGCGILYGTLRDSAYKLKLLAEKEKEKHIIVN
ncbi:MAG: hypothetical protein V3S16_17790, partial [Candidatus Desulfatibia sp.]|uniref:hypothetical protein n=1 Tax=Candidatus Desulfatibia sp. TaxID=3101189 RepID=UPI002F325E72